VTRQLLLFNALLAELSLFFGLCIVREGTAPVQLPTPPKAVRAAGITEVSAAPLRPTSSIIAAVVVARNLFDPSRTEPSIVVPEPSKPSSPPPVLHGVVVSDETAIAYLEDQSTKRTLGYRVGDALGDVRVALIAADHVVLAAAHQTIRVVLRDHRKVRISQLDEAPRNLTPAAAPGEFRGAVPPGAAAELRPRPPPGL
jgi:hypothetical protein